MNNRQPNRRRGRGNNNRTPNNNNNRNGYDNQNRVDNRARGNAAQMLEKYKKLAQDAQHIGDRVNGEYYLQFADHYFRVLADFRSRQEEGRPQREWRNDEREAGEDWRDDEREPQDEGEDAEPVADSSNEDEDYRRPQRQVQERPERNDRTERNDRPERNDRNARSRTNTNNNNRRDRNEPREPRAPQAAHEDIGLDLSILPPSIAVVNDEPTVAEEKPVRKPRARRPKTANDEDVVAAAE